MKRSVKVTTFGNANLTIISGEHGSGKTSLLWKMAEGKESSLSLLFETNPNTGKVTTESFVRMPVYPDSDTMVKDLISQYCSLYENIFIDHLPTSVGVSLGDLLDISKDTDTNIYVCSQSDKL